MRQTIRVLCIAVAILLVVVPIALGADHGETEQGGGHGSEPWYKSMNLWKTVNLCILLFVLYKFLAVPISKMLGERSHTIEEMLKSAEKQREEARRELDEMKVRLDSAKTEIEEIIIRGRDDARKMIEDIKESTTNEVELMSKRTADDLAQEFSEAQQDLVSFVATKAVQRAEQKIKTMDLNTLQTRYLKQFQTTLKEQGGNGEGP